MDINTTLESSDYSEVSTANDTNFTGNETSDPCDEDENTCSTDRAVVVLQECVIFVEIVGALANGTVISILVITKKASKKTTTNLFLCNQLTVDLFASVVLVITYVWKVTNIQLRGVLNVIVCFFIGSENLMWMGFEISGMNLVLITIERYFKIVHPIQHRNYYKKWMTYASIGFSWIVGILLNSPSTWVSTSFADDSCEAYTIWSFQDGLAYGIIYTIESYFAPLVIFVFCYWKMVLVIRKKGKVGVVTEVELPDVHCKSTTKVNERKIKNRHSVVRTMVMVTSLYAIAWSPNDIYFFLVSINCCGESISMTSSAWYATCLVAFLSQCMHPFIYGCTTDDVKLYLRKHRMLVNKLRSPPSLNG